MKPYVHLVGAGDTGSPLTGTVIEADTSSGATIEGLIGLPNMTGQTTPVNMAISDMSLDVQGELGAPAGDNSNFYGAIYDEGWVIGLTVQRVTVDATTDIPDEPVAYNETDPDIWINSLASDVRLLDCTFIGSGISGTSMNSTIDNCHFIGCGPVDAQISTNSLPPNADLSITRCTDQSLVNNITSPDGNVEYDGAGRLIWSDNTRGNLYIADNSTRDMYISLPDDGSGGGGAEIELEDSGSPPPNHNIVIYQNTLSGDGAEDLQDGDSGLEFAASDAIVAGNDISNLCNAIVTWNSGVDGIQQSFGMYVDNSIHNVTCGINAIFAAASVPNGTLPAGLGNSFSDNLINGIIGGGAAIALTPYVPDNQPPTVMMNVFCGDIVTGAAIGFEWQAGSKQDSGPTVLWDSAFLSNGSSTSQGISVALPTDEPLVFQNTLLQGFWN